jgi:hypothetical protein
MPDFQFFGGIIMPRTMLTAIALLCFSASGSARADETLKYRLFLHSTFAQSQEVGDVDGHTMSLVRFSGLASFPDGTVGTAYFVGGFDYIKGAGPFSVYYTLTLNDASVLWYKGTGTAAVDGTKTVFNGTVTVLGGKGRFEGAKGDGTYSGTRITPVSVGADLYADFTINLKK